MAECQRPAKTRAPPEHLTLCCFRPVSGPKILAHAWLQVPLRTDTFCCSISVDRAACPLCWAPREKLQHVIQTPASPHASLSSENATGPSKLTSLRVMWHSALRGTRNASCEQGQINFPYYKSSDNVAVCHPWNQKQGPHRVTPNLQRT